MNKNKSIVCCVAIMLSACWLQPLGASALSMGSDSSSVPKRMMFLAGATGLYAWGKYYEKKNPKMSFRAGVILFMGSVPAAMVAGMIGMTFVMHLTRFPTREVVAETFNVISGLTPFFIYSTYPCLLGDVLLHSYWSTVPKIHSAIEDKDYERLQALLQEKPGWAMESITLLESSVIATVVERCKGRNPAKADLDMLAWLLELSETSRICVRKEIYKNGDLRLEDWYKSLSKARLAKGYRALIDRRKPLPESIIHKISGYLVY